MLEGVPDAISASASALATWYDLPRSHLIWTKNGVMSHLRDTAPVVAIQQKGAAQARHPCLG